MEISNNLNINCERAKNDLEYCYNASKTWRMKTKFEFTRQDPIIYLTSNERLNETLKDKDYGGRVYSFKINDFSIFLDNHRTDIYKIAIICDNKSQVKKVLKSLEDHEVDVNTKVLEKDGKLFVELYSRVNDKLNGVMKIAKLNKIELDDVLAIVCSDNDINVSKNVKSVVVSNGSSKVKRICKEETLSNDEKGVEEVIDIVTAKVKEEA